MLVDALCRLEDELRSCFLQARVLKRFLWFMMAFFSVQGRHTLSAALPPGCDHSATYRVFSRGRWSLPGIFEVVVRLAVPYLGPKPFIPVALDDTYNEKTGRFHGMTRWIRDAVKSGYKTKLCRGFRWIHAALLVSIPGEGAQALSVAFELAQPLAKPGKGSSKEVWKEFRKEAVQYSAPTVGARIAGRVKEALDKAGCRSKPLLMTVDAGYMNRAFLRGLPDETGFLGRVRRDVHLVHAAPSGGRRFYGARAPTPEQLRKDDDHPWIKTRCYFGGAMRDARYKELGPVRWPRVTQRKDLRLLVVAPTPYWLPGRNRKGYNQPAFLLTSDLTSPAAVLLQTYFERWQIEVLHRDLKAEFGCGQPQVWSRRAVQRVVPSIAAFHALLRIAALIAFGPGRKPEIYGEPPPYRRGRMPRRPSARDLRRRLRTELKERAPGLLAESA